MKKYPYEKLLLSLQWRLIFDPTRGSILLLHYHSTKLMLDC